MSYRAGPRHKMKTLDRVNQRARPLRTLVASSSKFVYWEAQLGYMGVRLRVKARGHPPPMTYS